jgi:hypothetical protein
VGVSLLGVPGCRKVFSFCIAQFRFLMQSSIRLERSFVWKDKDIRKQEKGKQRQNILRFCGMQLLVGFGVHYCNMKVNPGTVLEQYIKPNYTL